MGDNIVGIAVLLICLGCVLFAKRIFYFSIRPGSFGGWYVKRFPQWMFPFIVWLIRVAGIVGAVVVVWVLFDKR